MAYEKGLLTFTAHPKTAFFIEGFNNWKKAVERFHEHEKAECHKEAKMKILSSRTPTVKEQLSNEAAKNRAENRRMLLKMISSIKYLLRQGLAIRGHSESEGNLVQLLSLRSEDDPKLTSFLKQQRYLSHEIINEIIGNAVLRQILSNIHEAMWYSVLADETTDISNQEQLSLSIRWVSKTHEVHEDFIGLVHVPNITASVLVLAIKDVLVRCSLPLGQCRGQAYDGAANMMGHLRGVATQLQTEETRAIPVHCFAHCLNLALQDTAKKSEPIKNALDIVVEICKLITFSPKRSLVFQQCKEELSIPGTGLRPLCPTRWTVRSIALDSVIRNYPALLEAFEIISMESHDDYGRRANGVLTMLEKFSVYFGLKLSFLVFSATEQVSKALQAKDTTVQEALTSVKAAELFVQRHKNDEWFEMFYDTAVTEAERYSIVPTLPRYRRPPSRLDDGARPHVYSSPKEYFRRQYYEVLDMVNGEISRFDQKSLMIPKAIEELLLGASKTTGTEEISIPDILINAYSEDINMAKLKLQLCMLPDLLKTYANSQNVPNLSVTSLRTISEVFHVLPLSKDMLSEIDILLRIYFTIPITTATAERSFSVLRRIKTYLRSTMSESRLNNVMLLHCHKDITDSLDNVNIAKTFIAVNSRRQNYFGNF